MLVYTTHDRRAPMRSIGRFGACVVRSLSIGLCLGCSPSSGSRSEAPTSKIGSDQQRTTHRWMQGGRARSSATIRCGGALLPYFEPQMNANGRRLEVVESLSKLAPCLRHLRQSARICGQPFPPSCRRGETSSFLLRLYPVRNLLWLFCDCYHNWWWRNWPTGYSRITQTTNPRPHFSVTPSKE